MKKNKIVIASIVAISGLILNSSVFAFGSALTPPTKQPSQGSENIVNALSQLPEGIASAIGNQSAGLQAEIKNLAIAAVDYVNHQNYQIDANLSADSATNTATTQINNQAYTPNQAALLAAENKTSNNLNNNLTQFSWALNPSNTALVAADGKKPFAQYMNENSTARLTIGTPANDTLYIADPLAAQNSLFYEKNQALLAKPNPQLVNNNNNYFNFASLFAPTVYSTTAQLQAANEYVKYATQNTQNLTTGVDFSQLASNPKALFALKNSPAYQEYAYNFRTLLAMRSMEVNALQSLVAERTPMPGLGAAAGLTTNAASPLQVDQYIANHRVQNPTWYQSIQTASPATVQRKTLVILAEIEHQNYEAQLQREQLIAQLAALNVQLNLEKTQGLIKEEGQKLNTEITTDVKQTP